MAYLPLMYDPSFHFMQSHLQTNCRVWLDRVALRSVIESCGMRSVLRVAEIYEVIVQCSSRICANSYLNNEVMSRGGLVLATRIT